MQENLDHINKLGSSNLAGRKPAADNTKENPSPATNNIDPSPQLVYKPKYQVKTKVDEQQQEDEQ